ncbi:hypothetical protein M0804_012532 [Polistes exclamans]|nr:hypothetical protein M0804_012532 [Polistes exclamans]
MLFHLIHSSQSVKFALVLMLILLVLVLVLVVGGFLVRWLKQSSV